MKNSKFSLSTVKLNTRFVKTSLAIVLFLFVKSNGFTQDIYFPNDTVYSFDRNSHKKEYLLIFRSSKALSRNFISESQPAKQPKGNTPPDSFYDVIIEPKRKTEKIRKEISMEVIRFNNNHNIKLFSKDTTFTGLNTILYQYLSKPNLSSWSKKDGYIVKSFKVNYLTDSLISIEITENLYEWRNKKQKKNNLGKTRLFVHPTYGDGSFFEDLFDNKKVSTYYHSLNYNPLKDEYVVFEDVFTDSSRSIIYEAILAVPKKTSNTFMINKNHYKPELKGRSFVFSFTDSEIIIYAGNEGEGMGLTKIHIPYYRN